MCLCYKRMHLEIGNAVSFLQSNLEDLNGADEGCQSCQALLATPAHPDQQGVSPGRLQDAVDATAEADEKGGNASGRELELLLRNSSLSVRYQHYHHHHCHHFPSPQLHKHCHYQAEPFVLLFLICSRYRIIHTDLVQSWSFAYI